jgi:hypothetical protein
LGKGGAERGELGRDGGEVEAAGEEAWRCLSISIAFPNSIPVAEKGNKGREKLRGDVGVFRRDGLCVNEMFKVILEVKFAGM